MRLVFSLVLIIQTATSFSSASPQRPNHNSEDYLPYDYYYDPSDYKTDASSRGGELPPSRRSVAAVTTTSPSLDDAFGHYDIEELVKAWREYMKEKTLEEKKAATEGNERWRNGESIRRPAGDGNKMVNPAGRQRQNNNVRRPVQRQRVVSPNTAGRRQRPSDKVITRQTGLEVQSPGLGSQQLQPSQDKELVFQRRPSKKNHSRRRPLFNSQPVMRDVVYYDYDYILPPNYEDDSSYFYDYYQTDQRTLSRHPGRIRQPLVEKNVGHYQCPPRDESYKTPDPVQCDKYYECNIKGEEKEMLCPDGLVFVIKAQRCDYPAKVNCTGRPERQPPKPSQNCPRANGFFAWEAEVSCQKFWDCREGKSYLQECPEGVIFDPKIDACVTPDQSARPECAAGKVLGFECPTYTSDDILRFGNHDRLPNPSDCQQFFTCLRTGNPRLGVCPRKTVFNRNTGHCDFPKNVEECKTYWEDKEEDELDDYYDYNG